MSRAPYLLVSACSWGLRVRQDRVPPGRSGRAISTARIARSNPLARVGVARTATVSSEASADDEAPVRKQAVHPAERCAGNYKEQENMIPALATTGFFLAIAAVLQFSNWAEHWLLPARRPTPYENSDRGRARPYASTLKMRLRSER